MEGALRAQCRRFVAREAPKEESAGVKTHTTYLTFNTKKRQEIIDISEEVEECRAAAGITEGMVLVSAMHISASVFVNDHEPGLWKDILDWLENRIAPWSPDDYRHNTGTGEDNAAAHLRSLTIAHEVIVPVTNGKLDFGPWQRVFYGEWGWGGAAPGGGWDGGWWGWGASPGTRPRCL